MAFSFVDTVLKIAEQLLLVLGGQAVQAVFRPAAAPGTYLDVLVGYSVCRYRLYVAAGHRSFQYQNRVPSLTLLLEKVLLCIQGHWLIGGGSLSRAW